MFKVDYSTLDELKEQILSFKNKYYSDIQQAEKQS